MGLALPPAQVEAQEKAGRMMLEAGFVGGSGDACQGRYVGFKGRIDGPMSPVRHGRDVPLHRFHGPRTVRREKVPGGTVGPLREPVPADALEAHAEDAGQTGRGGEVRVAVDEALPGGSLYRTDVERGPEESALAT